ncbi:ATP-binding region ATPase domain protein [Lancefieldella parvula DSM 20469]|uniref:ATP-binding region ATPase domain protein n=1 Tax=Lancefieldella parvula (strain ATCC 33793 / DSM 20469 / CCUG 32760 / JCM 10300 / KCTC 3663 / VPI 0546 / 1246) TaxID=521095 RepID=C8W8K3_LANP1|nr:ATP-binding protein [Lancefieldella parvula]ACV50441.1 ATP-binding region ATPase domain protein [Lancefieldella parvula DSM 20469]
MARDFFPFVEENTNQDEKNTDSNNSLTVRYAARIAVYDDKSAAPRVVLVEPKDVRSYLDEIAATVNQLAHEQGGKIPFMVMREIVENFIHARFVAPTISIMDNGNTIRFSDQGPGIKEKNRALEFGTSSATEEMKSFIRGVGFGLPYAQQYMVEKGGSLTLEDNISGGTIVTLSTRRSKDAHIQTLPTQEDAEEMTVSQEEQSISRALHTVPQQPVTQLPNLVLTDRAKLVLQYLSEHEWVGATELTSAYGLSTPTWSRELKSLVNIGIIGKIGQKYKLTTIGETLLS